jgi:hypothetical protein
LRGNAPRITVGGDLVGGVGPNSAEVSVEGTSTAIQIGGSIFGGVGSLSALVDVEGGLKSITVGGSVVAGTAEAAGSITTDNTIGSVLIKGSLIGTSAFPATIEAIGQAHTAKSDLALGSVKILGDSKFGDILAGQDSDDPGDPPHQNGSAQIGSVFIGHDFIASNISAGVGPGADGFYGTGDDAILPNSTAGIFASIAKIAIGGQALGTTDVTTDHFGIVAQKITSLKIGSVAIPVVSSALGSTGDLTVSLV